MQIMQDIPAEKRGLNHWATPPWLSIRNRQTTYARNYLGTQKKPKPICEPKKYRGEGHRPITIQFSNGKIVTYSQRKKAGVALGWGKAHPAGPLMAAIKNGEKLPNGNVNFKNRKGTYTYIPEA